MKHHSSFPNFSAGCSSLFYAVFFFFVRRSLDIVVQKVQESRKYLSEIVYSVEKTRGHLALRELKGVKNLDTWINDRKGTMLMGATRKVNYIFVESFYYYLKIWAWYFSFKFELRPPFSAINIDFKCYNRICKYSWTVMIELVPKLYRKKICI